MHPKEDLKPLSHVSDLSLRVNSKRHTIDSRVIDLFKPLGCPGIVGVLGQACPQTRGHCVKLWGSRPLGRHVPFKQIRTFQTRLCRQERVRAPQ